MMPLCKDKPLWHRPRRARQWGVIDRLPYRHQGPTVLAWNEVHPSSKCNGSIQCHGTDPAPRSGQYVCLYPACGGRSFARRYDLERHINGLHNQNRPRFDCPFCDRRGENGLPRKDKLLEHVRETHNVPLPKRTSSMHRDSFSPY